MAKENLSYVIKRIISFFHTPPNMILHIEKTRLVPSRLPAPPHTHPSEWVRWVGLVFWKDRRNNTNYSLHVSKFRLWMAQSWCLRSVASLRTSKNRFRIHFAPFSDRMLIEVLHSKLNDRSLWVLSRRQQWKIEGKAPCENNFSAIVATES